RTQGMHMLTRFVWTARRALFLSALGIAASVATTRSSHAGTLTWDWSYSAAGISASGTFTTDDTADGLGFYQIVGITGTRDGVAITGLQPTGTSIPGNEPFTVDNLIRTTGPQLTGDGFGFSTADGNFANPFFADFLSPQSYLEFYSVPASPPNSTELPITFT